MWTKPVQNIRAQELAAREVEALKYELGGGIDALLKTYMDIVRYEKKYIPEVGLEELEKRLEEHMRSVRTMISDVVDDLDRHRTDAINKYREAFDLTKPITAAEEALEEIAEKFRKEFFVDFGQYPEVIAVRRSETRPEEYEINYKYRNREYTGPWPYHY